MRLWKIAIISKRIQGGSREVNLILCVYLVVTYIKRDFPFSRCRQTLRRRLSECDFSLYIIGIGIELP
ncbi:hypothetical protein VNO77_24190 [Canavalia gladiata]|uniref:Uncharacterized protein n=1 Tax=Canavalia gladiata TaxID=3824 RepID=A0AAN9QC94_CANGL